eukprot:12910415-Ditylum_brightwellii.AAC.1
MRYLLNKSGEEMNLADDYVGCMNGNHYLTSFSAEKKDIEVNVPIRTIGTSMVTNDGIESHVYDGNFGYDSVPQDEENTFLTWKRRKVHHQYH